MKYSRRDEQFLKKEMNKTMESLRSSFNLQKEEPEDTKESQEDKYNKKLEDMRKALASSNHPQRKELNINMKSLRSSKTVSYTIGGIIFVTVLFIASMCFTIVPARTVGVGVTFGKPTAVYDNGFHFKSPITKVTKLDGSVQNNIYNGDSSVPVRLGNNSKAQVDVSVQWKLKTDNAQQLYLDYKTFDSIQSNLVDRNLRAALNDVMATYDPLASAKQEGESHDLADLAKQVQDTLTKKVGTDIEVRSITIPLIDFDESTQDKINELQAEMARTRIAQQKQSTSEAESRANEMLTKSLTNEVLTSKCLDIVERSGQSPLGCFPGSNQAIVDTTNK